MTDREELKVLVEQIGLKLMGEALDLARIGINGDRQFKQFERSLRSNSRQLIEGAKKLIDQSSDQSK